MPEFLVYIEEMSPQLTAPKPVIGHFKNIKPPYERSQSELVSWTTRCHQESLQYLSEQSAPLSSDQVEKFFRRYAVSPEKISKRSFECPDIESFEDWSEKKIYKITPATVEGVSIRERAHFFSERAQATFESFYPTQATLPSHLIHVTCTGYVSPSAAQLKAAGASNVAVTHAYHMGCYAALPAVRIAEAMVRASEDPQFRADIVHNEMCGLHMNSAENTPEQIVVQTLFADGHIKYSVGAEENFNKGFRILRVLEQVVPDSAEDMSWVPTSWGLQMTLSRSVPDKIASSLRPFLQKLLEGQEHTLPEVLKKALFAIHPGGPKIIDSVRTTLELTVQQTWASDKILFERGNMSSATLPHVWEEILNSDPKSGTVIISLAFGPGLTIFGAVFECL